MVRNTEVSGGCVTTVSNGLVQVGGLSAFDTLTGTTSHELIEAATDPYPYQNTAYGSVDDGHISWLFVLSFRFALVLLRRQSGD